MDAINNYKNSIGVTYTQNAVGSIEDSKKNQTKDNKISTSADSVEINQKDENIINTKKAYDAFVETSNQYQTGKEQFPPAFYFNMVQSVMEDRGMSVPNFSLDGQNSENMNFLSFVDKIKDFTSSLVEKNEIAGISSNFFEFCDKYKENLIKNGCS